MSLKRLQLVLVALLTLLSPAPAQALEGGVAAVDNDESRAVAALKIGKAGRFGDCTGTLVAPEWVVTARHCVEGTDNSHGQARFGLGDRAEIRNVRGWVLAPAGDIALLRLSDPVDREPVPAAGSLPRPGQEGWIYGLSSSGRMARAGEVPTAPVTVDEVTSSEDSETGALLFAHTQSGAGIQGGDSGGPLFVGGEVAGVITASGNVRDPERPSPNIIVTPVGEQKSWITEVIANDDPGKLVTPETQEITAVNAQNSPARGGMFAAVAAVLIAGIFVSRRVGRKERSSVADRVQE